MLQFLLYCAFRYFWRRPAVLLARRGLITMLRGGIVIIVV